LLSLVRTPRIRKTVESISCCESPDYIVPDGIEIALTRKYIDKAIGCRFCSNSLFQMNGSINVFLWWRERLLGSTAAVTANRHRLRQDCECKLPERWQQPMKNTSMFSPCYTPRYVFYCRLLSFSCVCWKKPSYFFRLLLSRHFPPPAIPDAKANDGKQYE
jgi:hypothetical protein